MSNQYVKTALSLAFASIATFGSMSAYAEKNAIMAVASTFSTLDPYNSSDTLSQAVTKSFYQGLYGFDKDMKVKNVLAEGYTVSDDGLEYTITLRQGVKFHDGTDFNANAVKVNFDRVTNPENNLKRYNVYSRIIKSEVIDPYTIKLTLREPYSPFINILAHPSAVMISPAALEKYGKQIGFNPVGTGPFTLVSWNPTDTLKVQKFADYWQPGLPKVDSITWYPVVENNTRAAMMQTGEAHFAFTIPFEQASVLQKNPNLELVSAPSIIQRYVAFNMLQKPFDDIRVRQAINYAINKDALIKVAFSGYAVPAVGIVPPGIDFAQSYGAWPYDPAKARELLKEAGYPNGFETQLWSAYNHTTAQKIIQFLQQQLGQVGIKAQIEALETGQRDVKVLSVQDPKQSGVRLYYVGWSASTGESDYALTPLLATSSWPPKMNNNGYYSNPSVDQLLAEALKTTDRARKGEIYKEAQDLIWADVPWVPLVTEQLLYVHSKKLSGMYVLKDGSFNFEDIELKD